MNSMEIMRGVEKIINQMVALKPRESVLVIRDWNTLDVLVEAFSLAAAARGADVFTWNMGPRRPGEPTPPGGHEQCPCHLSPGYCRSGRRLGSSAERSLREGGKKLKETCESFKDPNIYNIAEMAIGLNPYGKMSASGIESESKLGSAHIALGNSLGYGGTVKAPMHIDLVLLDCTVYLDDELIMENGVPRSFSIPQ
jgi:leucyl aminopeptidase (aminopeptidase T)